MGKVILCLGSTAKNPYCYEKLGMRVFSVEELCYYLKDNAYLLDDNFISKELTEWLDKECGLPELSGSLQSLIGKKDVLFEGIEKLLNYVGWNDADILLDIGDMLQSNVSLSKFQKRKQQGDFWLKNHQYVKALIEYDLLLNKIPENERDLKPAIWHNQGVALANLFAFSRAAECFWKAYQMKPDRKYYKEYLAAKRMQLNDNEYVEFIAEHPEAHEVSLELEREVDDFLENWEKSESCHQLDDFFELKNTEKNLYYEEMDIRVRALKEQYRECTQI